MSCWPWASSRRRRADNRFAASQQLRPTGAAGKRTDLDRHTGRIFVLLENQLPPADVVPAIELIADATIDADRFESHRLMGRDARGIWQRESGKRIEVALGGQDREQRCIE